MTESVDRDPNFRLELRDGASVLGKGVLGIGPPEIKASAVTSSPKDRLALLVEKIHVWLIARILDEKPIFISRARANPTFAWNSVMEHPC